MRNSVDGLNRFIATVQTSKHRLFQFVSGETVPDQTLVVLGSQDSYILGILSSRVHVSWTLSLGGTLEDRPRYTNSICFDPFPFPDPDAATRDKIASLAETIDRHRKEVQAAHPEVTLTQMYNVLEKVRQGALTSPTALARGGPLSSPADAGEDISSSPAQREKKGPAAEQRGDEGPSLSPAERRIFDDALILILKELHDELDAAVAQAYGWPAEVTDDEILVHLVALNKARAIEEARGLVRWLRPEYQVPRFGTPAEKAEQIEADLGLAPVIKVKPSFPQGAVEQTAAVMAALANAAAPISAAELVRGFKQGRKVEVRVAATLSSLARTGFISAHHGGRRFALRRVA